MEKGYCVKTINSYQPESPMGMISMRDVMRMFRCGFKTLGGADVESVLDHSAENGAEEIEYLLAGGSSVLLKFPCEGEVLTVCMSIPGDDMEEAEEISKRIRTDIENIVYMDLRAGYCCE